MSKKKPKKEKKILGVPTNINLGKKIKDIEMDSSKYKVSNLIFLIVLNVLLVAVMVYYLTIIYNIVILIIAIFTVLVCLVWSLCSYFFSVIKIKYTIYEFGVVKNFDTSKNIGEFAKLVGYKKKTSLIDVLGKNKTSTLVLKFANKWCNKITLTCITENVDELITIITTLASFADRQPQKQPKKKTLKEKLEKEFITDAPTQSKIAQEKERDRELKQSIQNKQGNIKDNNGEKLKNSQEELEENTIQDKDTNQNKENEIKNTNSSKNKIENAND